MSILGDQAYKIKKKKRKKVRPFDRWLHYSSDLCWLMEKTLMVMTPLCRAPQEFDYLDSTNELSTHPSLNLILALKTKWQIRSSKKTQEKERLELWAILLKNISFLVASDLNWIFFMCNWHLLTYEDNSRGMVQICHPLRALLPFMSLCLDTKREKSRHHFVLLLYFEFRSSSNVDIKATYLHYTWTNDLLNWNN